MPAVARCSLRRAQSRAACGRRLSRWAGSFTGLRVGLAAAKGLALANDLTLLGIPTLDTVAYPHQAQPVPVVAVLQAGRGRVYWAPYAHGPGGWAAQEPPRLSTVPELANTVVRPLDVRRGEVSTGRRPDADQLGRPAAGELPAVGVDLRRAGYLAELGGGGSMPGRRTTPRPSARSICSSRTARSGRGLPRSGHAMRLRFRLRPRPGTLARGHAVSADLVTVAPMTPDDLDEIMPLERQCFADPWTRRMYLSDLTTNEAATYLPRHGDAATRRRGEGRAGEDDLAVSPSHHVAVSPILAEAAFGRCWTRRASRPVARIRTGGGGGLGQWLMLALLDAAMVRGARTSTLEVRGGNLAGPAPLREAGIRSRRRAQALLPRRRRRSDHDHAVAGRPGDADTAGCGACD